MNKLLFILGFFLVSCMTTPKASVENYESSARKLVQMIDGNADSHDIQKEGLALVDLSQGLLDRFASKNPECTAYLNGAKKLIPQLSTISIEKIEKDYHMDGALPKSSTKCYHAKDLLVHPATVVAIAQKGGEKAKMKGEMIEVIEHLNEVKEHL